MIFVCKQTDAQPYSKEKFATFYEMLSRWTDPKWCKKGQEWQKEGEKLYYGKIFEAKGQFV